MESFQELALPAFLHESLVKMKFEKPTPIQAQSIPPGLEGKDVVASAETGSGKTAAFGIPLLSYLAAHPGQTALILTPTRELADQVREVLRQLAGNRGDLNSALLIGGMGMGAQVEALKRGTRLIIGTPGRIIDHMERRTLDLSRTGFLVLDEADRMLDMGFAPQLNKIRVKLPHDRQTLMFSATIPPDIQSLAHQYLRSPVRVAVGGESRAVEKIRQKVMNTSQGRKFDDLIAELQAREGSVLLFARTQHRVDRTLQKLKDKGLSAVRIHGGRTQGQRRMALEQFKNGSSRILVATDIAARGLDIQHIAHVINFDLPQNPEDYLHRIGRTARAGAEGDSLTFLTPEDAGQWKDILKELGEGRVAITNLPSHFTDHAAAINPQPAFRPGSSQPNQRHSQGQRPQGRSQNSSRGPSRPEGQSQGRPQGRPSQPHQGQPQGHRQGSNQGRDRNPRPGSSAPAGAAPHEVDGNRAGFETHRQNQGPFRGRDRNAPPHSGRPSGTNPGHRPGQGGDRNRPGQDANRRGPGAGRGGNSSSRDDNRGNRFPNDRNRRPDNRGNAGGQDKESQIKKWLGKWF